MNYRSDVGIAISNKLINGISNDHMASFAAVFGFPYRVTDDGDYLYIVKDIRWDNIDDEDISAIEGLASEWDVDPSTRDELLFIRLGEDCSDVDHLGQWIDNPFGFGWAHKLVLDDM